MQVIANLYLFYPPLLHPPTHPSLDPLVSALDHDNSFPARFSLEREGASRLETSAASRLSKETCKWMAIPGEQLRGLHFPVPERGSEPFSRPAPPCPGRRGQRRGCSTRGVRVTPCGHCPRSCRAARARQEHGLGCVDPAPPARAFLRPRDRQRRDSSSREEEEEPRSDQKGEWLSEPPGASAESEAWRGIRGVLSPVKDRSAAVLPCVCLARQSPAGMWAGVTHDSGRCTRQCEVRTILEVFCNLNDPVILRISLPLRLPVVLKKLWRDESLGKRWGIT